MLRLGRPWECYEEVSESALSADARTGVGRCQGISGVPVQLGVEVGVSRGDGRERSLVGRWLAIGAGCGGRATGTMAAGEVSGVGQERRDWMVLVIRRWRVSGVLASLMGMVRRRLAL